MGSEGEIVNRAAVGGGGTAAAAEIRDAKEGIDQVGSEPPVLLQPGVSGRDVAAGDDPATEKRGTPEMEEAGGTAGGMMTAGTGGLRGAPVGK